MDEKQIVFITCVNDEEEYGECCYYLDRLNVPEGYRMDRICVKEAPSMAEGYNAAMNSSDAKYKVYLHQDVMIRNRNFIPDLLAAFARDRKIGILGVVGSQTQWEDMTQLMSWDAGKVETDDSDMAFNFEFPKKEDGLTEVWMADGLLLATQYDLTWREDLFDNWHFYDLSQCMEFKKAGYKVAVPWQESAWCYHEASISDVSSYFDYYERFAREYGQRADFPVEKKEVILWAYKEVREGMNVFNDFKKDVENHFATEDRIWLRKFFEENADIAYLQEYRCIVSIDRQEEENRSPLRLWSQGLSLQRLLSRFRALKHTLKRIQYGVVEQGFILEGYSAYAVEELGRCYFHNAVISATQING